MVNLRIEPSVSNGSHLNRHLERYPDGPSLGHLHDSNLDCFHLHLQYNERKSIILLYYYEYIEKNDRPCRLNDNINEMEITTYMVV